MSRILALIVLFLVLGQATGALEFALGDPCEAALEHCSPACPACVLCSCSAGARATIEPTPRLLDGPRPVAIFSEQAGNVPVSHPTPPPRQPPRFQRA